jgi:hypothetical protein
LDGATLPRAAAATATHYFLSRPVAWMPTIALPEIASGQEALRG